MNTKNHKIIKGCHVAFDSKPSKELEFAISEMIDIARNKIENEPIKNIDQIYKDWCGESHLINSCHPVHDSAEACDFAQYYHSVMKDYELKSPICPHCHKYKMMQGNGIMHQLCECGQTAP